MLDKLLLVTRRELGLDMIGMTTKCMKTMHHIGNIVVMHSLSHSRCLPQQTENMTAIPRVELLEGRPHTRRFEVPVEKSSERVAIFQTKVYVIQAEPEATAKHTSSLKININ